MQKHITLFEMDYDLLGNIISKSDVGEFNYDYSNKPNAVAQIQPTPSYDVPEHNISYFASGRTKFIEDTQDNRIEFVYGPNNQRRKSEYYYNNNLVTTTHYSLGNYEVITDEISNEVAKIYYIGSPEGLVAMRKTTTSTNELYYVLTDHLGSIETLCDIDGNVVESYSYDAWGNRRFHANWAQPDYRTSFITNRGFTGHEHLLNHRLINMNGRMDDPMLARMLSPDPFVTNPSLGQDYNRYSYVRNNPLKYTDPSGYIVNGGNNVFFNSLYLHAGMISKDREWWNNNLDKAYHRGDYALIGGFGGTNATFAIGGSVLNVGSVAGGFLGDGSMLTQQGKDFVKSHTGSTPVNKDGVWGSWQDGHYYELHNYTMEFKEGEFTSFNTMALVTTSRFVPFSDSYSTSVGSQEVLGATLVLTGSTSACFPCAATIFVSGVAYAAYLYFKEAEPPSRPNYTYEYRPPTQDPINWNLNNPPDPNKLGKLYKWILRITLTSELFENIINTHSKSNLPKSSEYPIIYPTNP